jgi:hypothetical protein
MKRSLIALAAAVLCVAPAQHAAAQDHDHDRGLRIQISEGDHDSPARVGPRRDPADARFAIRTSDDVVALMLTRDAVAMQLTDRGLRHVRGEMERDMEAEHGDDGVLARMIQSVVRTSVGSMLRRSIEYPVSELRSVTYERGRLVFVTEDGEEVFDQVEVNGSDVMEGFSAADARAFVREFHALKARTR